MTDPGEGGGVGSAGRGPGRGGASRFSGLYVKICATFLAVVVLALLSGGSVFFTLIHRPVEGLRSTLIRAMVRHGAADARRLLAEGVPPQVLPDRLGLMYSEFPGLRFLYRDGAGGLHGGHPDVWSRIDRELEAASGEAGDGLLYRGLGPGRGFIATVAVGPGRSSRTVPGDPGPARLALVGEGVGPRIHEVATRAALAGAGAIILTSSVLGLAVFRSLARRLERVRRALLDVARGELSRRVDRPGNDEIGDLGRSFNRMADRLQQAERILAGQDAARRRFLADVSHELKTPLTSLKGHLEQLHTRDGERGTPVAVAREEVERLGALVEDLLELARLDSQEFRLRLEEEVLQRVAARAVRRMDLAARNREVDLVTRFPPEPIPVRLDPRRIEQVLVNLLDNALRSLDGTGRVEVRVALDGERVRIEIEDDGPGIPESLRERIFERFATGSADGGGTGLGLSIVKRLVEAHHGRVALEPVSPHGTRAIVELPAAAGEGVLSSTPTT